MVFLVYGGLRARDAKLFFLVYLQMKFSPGVRWRASVALWKSSGVEISHRTSNWLFHRHRGRTYQFFPTPPCTLVGVKEFPAPLATQAHYSSCWCQIGHKGAPKCHRFCPGTFLHLQIPITGEAQETLAFRSLLPKLTWQRHYHGFNHKTLES